jgi:hypothetical protein
MKGKALAGVVVAFACLLGAASWIPNRGPVPDVVAGEFVLNALDYQHNIYDLRKQKLGISRQVDKNVREYLGDILFTGQDFSILESDQYTGTILDLGEEDKPDTEFSLFYSLCIYKRVFQRLQFPYRDRFAPWPGIDSNRFFGDSRDPVTSIKLEVAHLYLLRLFHRTRVGDEKTYLLRVLEFVPGIRVHVLTRELSNQKEV